MLDSAVLKSSEHQDQLSTSYHRLTRLDKRALQSVKCQCYCQEENCFLRHKFSPLHAEFYLTEKHESTIITFHQKQNFAIF